ncbi:MAG: hypothetical protein EBZ74_01630 [Planctomycetia bacterium]|nr:hypothetical protein [Planctomycetia bacterium]
MAAEQVEVDAAADSGGGPPDVELLAAEFPEEQGSAIVDIPIDAGNIGPDSVVEAMGEPMPRQRRPRGQAAPATKWLAGADYLLLRPTFSNATALLSNRRSGGLVGFTPVNSSLDSLDYDFGYGGGVRGFLGYQATPDHVFRFTYMNFYAQTAAVGVARGNWAGGNGTIILGPYNTGADAVGESISSVGSVGLNIYDLEWARRIDVGAECRQAPVWDVAAGAGIRFLDSRVGSLVFNDVVTAGFPDLLVTTNRTFSGVGPRIAGQVRRYLGANRRWSGFGAVGGSLLVGSLSNTSTRLTLDQDQTSESQVIGGSTVIPNVDVSLGGTWQMRPRTSISVGWMLMYFGTLGYAETVQTNATPVGTPVSSVPLANSSLSLDGVFFRLTHAF